MTRRYVIAVGMASLLVLVDSWTKRWASIHFVDNPLEVIPGFLTFTFTENPGAAFGSLQNAGPILGVAAIGVTLGLFWALRHARPGLEVVAFGLIMGGAVGNLVDRIFRGPGLLDGKVIDWVN
ncbi:MAG: signal peptidase II, partial [Actinomycetota bacterium]|nr:signal peptidase II [Actinomycetota bacterium]